LIVDNCSQQVEDKKCSNQGKNDEIDSVQSKQTRNLT